MSKNVEYVSHKKSELTLDNGSKPKLPEASALTLGEIAINFAENVETLSIKNKVGTVVPFSSDNYYTKQKLGSGFTGENSAVTVTQVIDEIDLVTSTALNDLESRKLDASAYTPTDLSNYYTKAETSGATEISTALNNKVDSGEFTNHTGNTSIHHTHSNKSYLDTVSGNVGTMAYENTSSYSSATEVQNALSDKQDTLVSGTNIKTVNNQSILGSGNIDIEGGIVDQTIDSGTSASTHAVATKAVYELVSENELIVATSLNDLKANKLDVSAFTAYSGVVDTSINSKASQTNLDVLSGVVSAHTADSTVHITSAERTTWNAKVDSSSLNGYADSVKYNSATKYVEFYHGTTAGTKVFEYDASPFIIDGMVENVEIKDVTISGQNVSCLVISFNTAAGKQDINIPISDIFDSNQYYTKDDIDDMELVISQSLNDLEYRKVDSSAFTAYSAATATEIGDKLSISDFNSYSGLVDTAIGLKASQSDLNALSGTVTGHTSNTAIHFTSGDVQTQINNSISGKVDTSTFNTHTASTVHMSTTEKTNLDSLETNIATISGITSIDRTKWDALTRRTRKTDFDFATLRNAITDQSLEKYGLKVGDYKTINGHDYVIAGLNVMAGSYSPYRVNLNHVGLIVIPHTTQAWNVSGNTYQSTYTYSTDGTWTTGAAAGYANSDLHHYITETLLPIVKTDLGTYASGILKHNKLYSNAVNTSGYNRFGSAGGCSSSWAWYTNQEICALSEVQVYGSTVWSSSGYDTGEACRQLDVFRVYNMNEIFGWEYPWLRDVASASNACIVADYGHASYNAASIAYYVAALILFA